MESHTKNVSHVFELHRYKCLKVPSIEMKKNFLVRAVRKSLEITHRKKKLLHNFHWTQKKYRIHFTARQTHIDFSIKQTVDNSAGSSRKKNEKLVTLTARKGERRRVTFIACECHFVVQWMPRDLITQCGAAAAASLSSRNWKINVMLVPAFVNILKRNFLLI